MLDCAWPRVECANCTLLASATFVDAVGSNLSAPVYGQLTSGGRLQSRELLTTCTTREGLRREARGTRDG